ncbi:helix-turn-helix transcriptional regulator [Brenneria populi subsp. brevivirga]|uniref:XRE family transcriptional regulator n=1 Tax=Brenneria populi TaxID=1505588 RepID=UPI002E18A106|nr:helix-turn-helix transcriptional regulator [Brenneria populi subsp. brevivirga]
MNSKTDLKEKDSCSKREVELFNKGIGERLRYIRTDVLHLSVAGMSKKFNVGTSTIQRYESGERTADALFIAKVAQASGMDERWVLRGHSTDKNIDENVTTSDIKDILGNPVDINEFAFIPRYDVRAAAGHGALNESETPSFTMAFRKYWIKNYLNADYRHLFVITVDGSSLEGTLNDGDSILVNNDDTNPKEGIYVLRMDGHLLVKLVQRIPGGLLKVSSTNAMYEPFTVDLNNLPTDFAIIGRVVWFGRTI